MAVSSGLHWFHTAGALRRRQQLYALSIMLTLGLTLGIATAAATTVVTTPVANHHR